MKAVIVAAGQGKRMMPLTANTPKPLLTLRGTPIIEYLLRGLRWSGISQVVIVVRYLGDEIRKALGDGSKYGMSIEYAEQQGPDGTGSALLAAETFVENSKFMLLWGDVLMDPSQYRRIQELYAEDPCDLLSTLNWLDDPTTGASVSVEVDRIIAIEEKPPPGTARSNWNQAGLFICTRRIIEAVKECGLSPRNEIEFTTGVQRLIEMGGHVRWMPMPPEDFWSDVGTPEALNRLDNDPAVKALLR